MTNNYDVIIIGAGHAGIEAALAASRMKARTLLVTLSKDTIGLMSCNPAIGGVGKGQLVKEIDALGGEMARAADACGIQFRILNASKGPAVHSSRAQVDTALYQRYMRQALEKEKYLSIKEAEAEGLWVEEGRISGLALRGGEKISGRCVVICPGTFLNGLIHVGLTHHPGGRIGEPAVSGIPESLGVLGFKLLRFKTGTCPRLDKSTIDFSRLKIQQGDLPPQPFSFATRYLKQRQAPCYITYTNPRTHQIIRDNLSRSPLYAGVIKACGVRYCPSIEDKVVKFSGRPRHQVFLEPEGLRSRQVYPNGISTSLPEDVQEALVHSIEGLEEAKILRFGYGIEHTVVEPTQLYPTLEAKGVGNLYLAGQINGTTGYEEAAAQGLIAGANAALRAQGRAPLVLDRSSSYIGVLLDDLTTKGTNEPYRMFTSRVEYRLILREDNADLRLSRIGGELGLLKQARLKKVEDKERAIKEGVVFLKKERLSPAPKINHFLEGLGTPALRRPSSLEEILRRPQVTLKELSAFDGLKFPFKKNAFAQIEINVKYAGFIQRQLAETQRFQHLERIRLPGELDYNVVPGLSREIREKLQQFRPLNLGQASRISGVTPVAVSVLMVYLRKIKQNG